MATPLRLTVNPPATEGFPWDDLRKICRGRHMARVPNGVETLPKISTGSVGRTNVTDRRQTVGRQHSERELKINTVHTAFNMVLN